MNVFRAIVQVAGAVSATVVLSTCGTGANKESATDADGNVYATVKIGNQVWTVENLRTTKYDDGTPIPYKTDRSEWAACYDSSQPAYCWYENDTGQKERYGALYNWYAVNTGKLAPKGWHVPTDTDWMELEKYLMENGFNWDGSKDGQKIAKSMAAKTDWLANDESGTVGNDVSKNNRSGFSALPGGFRLERGDFHDIGIHAYWWSATKYDESRAWRRSLYNDKVNLLKHYGTLHTGCGFSVRLLKD